MTDMFTPLKYPAGTPLLIPWNQEVTLCLKDFVVVYGSTFKATFDFGLGNIWHINSTDAPTDPQWSIKPTFGTVQRLTLRLLLEWGDETTGIVRERLSWPVQIGCPANEFHRTSSMPFIAVAQGTFQLPVGTRQALMPLIPTTSIGSSGGPGGTSGLPMGSGIPGGSGPPSGGGPLTSTVFASALDALTRRLQQAFAVGFGRLPVPTAELERAICVQLQAESLVYGTSGEFQSDLSTVEYKWRQFLEDPRRADALEAMAYTMRSIATLYPDLRELGRANLVGGDFLVPGPHTINWNDVAAWCIYASGSVDDSLKLGVLPLKDWSVHQGNFDRNLPTFDREAAWRFYVVYQVMQAIIAFYGVTGMPGSAADANILITAAPGVEAYSVRIFDATNQFWLQVTLAEVDSNGHIELGDLNADGQAAAKAGGGYVAARSVGVVGLSGNSMPPIFDVASVTAALDGSAFCNVPTVSSMDTSGVSVYQDTTGVQITRAIAADGTSLVGADNSRIAVMTIATHAVPLPDGKDSWSNMMPHALLALRGGQMQPVMRRG